MKKILIITVTLAFLGIAACGTQDVPETSRTIQAPTLIENAPDCNGVCETAQITVDLPNFMQVDWQNEVNLAPNTATPPDVLVCGTVENLNTYPGSDCVVRTAQVIGNVLQVSYVVRIGYVYTIAYYYAGQFRSDQMTVTIGASAPVAITGHITRGGLALGDPNSLVGGKDIFGRAYGCFNVDRLQDGTLVVESLVQAPCNGGIYDHITFYALDSSLTVTSTTRVDFQTSFMFDITGATNINAGGAQPVIRMTWDGTRHTYTLYSVPVGMEHWVRAATPQTNPATGLLVNLNTIQIGEVSIGGVVTNPGETYVNYANLASSATAPDYYAAAATSLTGVAPHISQPADNRTVTIGTP